MSLPILQRRIVAALDKSPAPSVSDLARRLGAARPSVSRAVGNLASTGLIARTGRRLDLTPAGETSAAVVKRAIVDGADRRSTQLAKALARDATDLRVLSQPPVANNALLKQRTGYAQLVDQVNRLIPEPMWQALQQQAQAMSAIANSPYFRSLQREQAAVKSLLGSPGLQALIERNREITGLINSPPWRDFQQTHEAMTKIVNDPGFRAVQEQHRQQVEILLSSGWMDRVTEVWKLAHTISAASATAQARFQELAEREESGEVLQFAGLVPTIHMPAVLRREVIVLFRQGQTDGLSEAEIQRSIHVAVVTHYDANECAEVRSVGERLKQSVYFGPWSMVIEESVHAHVLNLDAISAFALCAMIEGSIKDFLADALPAEERPLKTKHKELSSKLEPFIENVPQDLRDATRLIAALDNLYRYWDWEDNKDIRDQETALGRHALLHGFRRGGTRLDTIHCFLVLDLLAELFSFIKEETAVDAA